MDFENRLRSSAKELTNVRALTACAMLAAIAVVLNYVASIKINDYIKIGFGSIPNQLVDALFGPVTGALFGGALDIIKFVLKPDGAFFPGYTLSAMLAAFIYGLFYYKRPITILRVLIAKGIVTVLVNMLLNTYWSTFFGSVFTVIFPARAIKNLIMWPIDSVVFFLVYTALSRTGILKWTRKEEKTE